MLHMKDAVKKGDIIMEAEPFVYVLQQKFLDSHCDFCLSEGEMQKCSGCQYVYYCNRDCQKNGWKMHKFECKNMKRVQPLTLPDTARLFARIIIKFRNGQGDEKGYYMANKYRTFNDLMSHSEKMKKMPKKMEHIHSLKCVLEDFFSGEKCVPDFEQLLEIYGRVNTNSFHIFHNIENIAIGIYLGPSILDHSCTPNAIVSFEGTKLYARVLEDIPEYDISKIRISYIDLMQTTEARNKELKEIYNFTCNCTKCEEPDIKSDAMACSNSECKNYCNVKDNTCSKCNHCLDKNFKEKFEDVKKWTDLQMSDMRKNKDMYLIEKYLEKQTGIFHDLNIKRIKTLEVGKEIAIDLQLWEKALSFSTQLIPGYLEYYSIYHNVTIELYLTVAKLQLCLEKVSDAKRTLKEIEPILSITHGKEHYYSKLFTTFINQI